MAEPAIGRGEDPDSAFARARDLLSRLRIPENLWSLSPVTFSGGEQQRVNIARGFSAPYPILLLDDPLSAVDTRTEKAILAALEREKRQRSVILVTHRVAAASVCDRVIVLDGGRIVEQGTHEQLGEAEGLYAAFIEEQRIEQELEQLAVPAAEEASP